jgi:hypothetical protein
VNYHIVFDALQNGSQLAICLFIPLFVLVPGVVGWVMKRSHDPHYELKGNIFLYISIASFGISLVVATISFSEYHQMKIALAQGDYQVTEGIVSEFVPMPPSGLPVESFSVGGSSFHYGSGWDSIVFNSESNRGYIHNGAQVRITHRGINIVRVEVK